ncbi:MAG: hypothetical protein SFU53_08065 [Terrimicrobiaceae bacterium]|nr:hypothetical protein [Terrimicrobiaceae bacterium]
MNDDEENLPHLEGRWFHSAAKQLYRIEKSAPSFFGGAVDEMPDWAVKPLIRTLREIVNVAGYLDRSAFLHMTDGTFGELLGNKVACARLCNNFVKRYEKANDSERASLTRIAGGVLGVEDFRTGARLAERVFRVEKSVCKKVRKEDLSLQGRFFEGYGKGLQLFDRVEAIRNLPEQVQKRIVVSAYIVSHWVDIDRAREVGGWPCIYEGFIKWAPESAEISEEMFQKSLRRLGIGPVGKVGRPKISGQESRVLS